MRQLLLAAIAFVAASGSVNAATDNDRLQDWVRLDAEIHRATQAMASDADAARPAVEELLKRVDLINSASDAQHEESTLSRTKRDALRGPLYNLRLALEHPAMASQIAMLNANPRGPLMSAEGVAGISCDQAIELVPGQPMRIEIPANTSRWITVRSPLGASSPLALTTLGSDIDAAVDVYADCRETGMAALSSGDDNHGLQAIALLPPAAHPLMLEIRNQGERGIATIDAITAVTITGRITRSDTGAAIASLPVEGYRGTNPNSVQFAGSTTSQATGNYQLTTFTTGPGNTYMRTRGPTNQLSYIDKTWDDVPCTPAYGLSDCGPGTPTAVATEDGVAVSNIDFVLSRGATIYGTVVDRSGSPVYNASVSINQVGGVSAVPRAAMTDNLGRYRADALPTGQYRVAAGASGYKSQVFRDFDCDTDCGTIAGTPVSAVESGQSLANFSLSRANSIRVTFTVGGQPTNNYVNAQIIAVNEAGTIVATASSNGSGAPTVLGPLPAGIYRVHAQGFGLVPEYYQDVVCGRICGPAEFQAATPILVNNDVQPVDIAMDLGVIPALTGTVTSTTGAPIPNANIILYRGFSETYGSTGSDGTYRLRPRGLGDYLVHAATPNHIDELHDNIPCNRMAIIGNCLGGTPVTFTASAAPSPVNFELSPSAIVRGRVIRLPVNPYFQIFALTSMNQDVNGVLNLQSNGTYQLDDLPEGQFRIGYAPAVSLGRLQFFKDVVCGPDVYRFNECPATGATLVNLVSGTIVDEVNFTNRTRFGRLGQVTDEATGLPVSGVIIDAFDSTSGQRSGSAVTDGEGRFDIASDFGGSGNFSIATDNQRGYVNEVYNNIQCPVGSVYLGTCPLTGSTPVAFPGDGSELLIVLRRDDMVFRSGFD